MNKHTALFDMHKAANATMVEFAGWDMPLHYGSQIAEHKIVRTAAGMFDVSHMGIIDIVGADAREFLSILLANNIHKLTKPGTALYSCMLNDRGGIIDDLIVYYMQNEYFRLVVNASTVTTDLSWILSHASKYNIVISQRNNLAIIAVQGPLSIIKTISVMEQCYADLIQHLKRFSCVQCGEIFIARTGYTGENGVELIMPKDLAVEYWQRLLAQDIQPIGLGARDLLRLEAGYNLYGNDMDLSVTPFESNLAWTVALEPQDRNFIGRSALEAQLIDSIPNILIGVELLEKGILRHGQKIYLGAKEVGVVTSGTFSPSLGRAIGLARVAMPLNKDYFVDIRGKKHAVRVVIPPFV